MSASKTTRGLVTMNAFRRSDLANAALDLFKHVAEKNYETLK